jgi:hypothetical protein
MVSYYVGLLVELDMASLFFSSSLIRGQEGMIHFFSILKFHLVPLLETTLVPKTRYLLKKTE